VKEQWGKLSDDDLMEIQGRREQLVGKIQTRYGISQEEAEAQVSGWNVITRACERRTVMRPIFRGATALLSGVAVLGFAPSPAMARRGICIRYLGQGRLPVRVSMERPCGRRGHVSAKPGLPRRSTGPWRREKSAS